MPFFLKLENLLRQQVIQWVSQHHSQMQNYSIYFAKTMLGVLYNYTHNLTCGIHLVVK